MTSQHPYLLYAYPWMPFPRRVIIYLREKRIPSSLVTVVPVSDPGLGDAAPPTFPPRPEGSLPILCIPSIDDNGAITYPTKIRQSIAIMNYLDELCDAGANGFPKSAAPMRGTDILSRARETELLCLSDELTTSWNPIRTFGTAAGGASMEAMANPAVAAEMLKWTLRTLRTIENWFQGRDFERLRKGGDTTPTIAEIVLYQFLEFTLDCYGKDMTKGSGETVKDVYGREKKDEFGKIEEFFNAFKSRDSARRDPEAGEVAGEKTLERMQTWY